MKIQEVEEICEQQSQDKINEVTKICEEQMKIKIEQVIGEVVYFNFQNKQFKIDRKNGNLIENYQNKVTLLKCEVSKFKM